MFLKPDNENLPIYEYFQLVVSVKRDQSGDEDQYSYKQVIYVW